MGGAAAVALLVWGIWAFRSRGPAVPASASSAAGATPQNVATLHNAGRSLRIHGTVEALDYRSISAPRLSGQGNNSMVITKLLLTGAHVKAGDVVVEFDRQQQEKNALDRLADFRDLEEQIKKKSADNAGAESKDVTELKQAENAVQTAELEMKKNEVISRIDAEKNAQTLEEAKANLTQLRETLSLKRVARQADLRSLEIQRDRAKLSMEYARRNREKLAIHAPINGLVVVQPIWMNAGMREVQEGDEVRPGNTFMQVVNPQGMQVRARINQTDIGSLQIGQAVKVRLDAYPDLALPGKLLRLTAVGTTSMMNNKIRVFTGVFTIDGTDPRLLPDLSAAVDVGPGATQLSAGTASRP
jgi:multidrug efflux pump subunit AcrA (membrane-fusion protein)